MANFCCFGCGYCNYTSVDNKPPLCCFTAYDDCSSTWAFCKVEKFVSCVGCCKDATVGVGCCWACPAVDIRGKSFVTPLCCIQGRTFVSPLFCCRSDEQDRNKCEIVSPLVCCRSKVVKGREYYDVVSWLYCQCVLPKTVHLPGTTTDEFLNAFILEKRQGAVRTSFCTTRLGIMYNKKAPSNKPCRKSKPDSNGTRGEKTC